MSIWSFKNRAHGRTIAVNVRRSEAYAAFVRLLVRLSVRPYLRQTLRSLNQSRWRSSTSTLDDANMYPSVTSRRIFSLFVCRPPSVCLCFCPFGYECFSVRIRVTRSREVVAVTSWRHWYRGRRRREQGYSTRIILRRLQRGWFAAASAVLIKPLRI